MKVLGFLRQSIFYKLVKSFIIYIFYIYFLITFKHIFNEFYIMFVIFIVLYLISHILESSCLHMWCEALHMMNICHGHFYEVIKCKSLRLQHDK